MSCEHRRIPIIESAIKILMQNGIAATSMNDLIRASGLSKGGVYHHFSGKDDILIGILEYFFEQYCVKVTEIPEDIASAYDKLHHMLTQHEQMLLEMGQYNQLFQDMFAHAARNTQLKQQFELQYLHFQKLLTELIKLGVDNGEFKSDIDAKAIASGLIGVFDGICMAMSVAEDAVKFPDYAIQSALSMLNGIRVL